MGIQQNEFRETSGTKSDLLSKRPVNDKNDAFFWIILVGTLQQQVTNLLLGRNK